MAGGLGQPGSRVALGTRARPGSQRPSSQANAVLGNRKKATATSPLSQKSVYDPKYRYVKGADGKMRKDGLKAATTTGSATTGGTKGYDPKYNYTKGSDGKMHKGGLKPTAPAIPEGDVIDQAGIRNLWHQMQYGDGTHAGISGYQNQIDALAKDDFAQYKTLANQTQNAFKTNVWDWNAQAAASGMLNSGGRTTNHTAMLGERDKSIEELHNTVGAGAALQLNQQRNDMKAQYMRQILNLLGEKNAGNLQQIVGE